MYILINHEKQKQLTAPIKKKKRQYIQALTFSFYIKKKKIESSPI